MEYGLANAYALWLSLLMLLYILKPIPAYLFVIYIRSFLFPHRQIKPYLLSLSGGCWLILLISLISLKWPILYALNPINFEFTRGPLFILIYVTELLYVAYASLIIFVNRKKLLLRDLRAIITILTPSIVGVLMQLMDYGVYSIYTGGAISILFASIHLELIHGSQLQFNDQTQSSKKKSVQNIWTKD